MWVKLKSVNKVVVGKVLDSVISEIFSNLIDSVNFLKFFHMLEDAAGITALNLRAQLQRKVNLVILLLIIISLNL